MCTVNSQYPIRSNQVVEENWWSKDFLKTRWSWREVRWKILTHWKTCTFLYTLFLKAKLITKFHLQKPKDRKCSQWLCPTREMCEVLLLLYDNAISHKSVHGFHIVQIWLLLFVWSSQGRTFRTSLQQQHNEGYCAAVAETAMRDMYKTGVHVVFQWSKKLLRKIGGGGIEK